MSVLTVIQIFFRLFWRAGVIYLCALAAFISCYITFLQQDIGLPVSVVLLLVLLLSVLAVYAWAQNNLRVSRRKVAILLKQEPLSGLIQHGFKQVEDNLVHTIKGMEVTLMVSPRVKQDAPSLAIVFNVQAPFDSPDTFAYSDRQFFINRHELQDEVLTVLSDFADKYNAQQIHDICCEAAGYLKRQGFAPVAENIPQDLSHFR